MLGKITTIKDSKTQVCSKESFYEILHSPKVNEVCTQLRDICDKNVRGEITPDEYDNLKTTLKGRLPAFFFHATFKDGIRKNENAIPTGFSIYDVDHIEDPEGYWAAKRTLLQQKGSMQAVVLAHKTPSSKGLRLVFVVPKGMTLEQAQRWMSGQLDDPDYDACVKDYARASFAVPAEYLFYIDEERLFAESVQPFDAAATGASAPISGAISGASAQKGEASAPMSGAISGASAQKGEASAKSSGAMSGDSASISEAVIKAAEARGSQSGAASYPSDYRGVSYADIVREYFKLLCGGEPQVGERNEKLFKAACDLRYITDDNEALLLSILPSCGLQTEELKSLIHSACTRDRRSLSKLLRKAISAARSVAGEEDDNFPPEMPSKLPAFIKLLVSRTPDIYKPTVAHAVFPALGAQLYKVKFPYLDGVDHEATLMNVLMAGTGSGKSCINKPIELIMKNITQQDEVSRRKLKEWQEEYNTKGANKDKPKRPDAPIRYIESNITNPAFVSCTANANGYFLYTKMDEIKLFDNLASKKEQQFEIMCLAFDPDNHYGQMRVSAQAVTEKVQIRLNWNISTTINQAQRYFSKVLIDGPVSRINFCTIPTKEIGEKMPVFGTYGKDFEDKLKPYIDNLTNAKGRIVCQKALRLIEKIYNENIEYVKLTQNRVYENLSHRALIIAYLKSCVLYVANGCKWEKSIDDFIRWSFQYDMWCKMHYFGEAIARAESCEGNHPGPASTLEKLPKEFTLHDLIVVRNAEGKDDRCARNLIAKWIERNKIRMVADDKYSKIR